MEMRYWCQRTFKNGWAVQEMQTQMHLVRYKRFQFCYFLNTEKCIPPIQNIECLMKSERSFVTVQRIDGVEIPPWPSPCTHKEQSQMTEHQASFQKMSSLILYCIAGLLPDIFHNCMSRFNYFMSSLIKSKLIPFSYVCDLH